MNILITGATGNVGMSVLKHLTIQKSNLKVFAGVRNIEKGKDKLQEFNVSLVTFDFEEVQSFRAAFKGIDILFLLRPPQLADVEKYFKPLIDEVVKCDVKQIVFLSVQGVENSKIIPHHKIEKLITDYKIAYTFLRPAYFMQNFTTTLRNDLVNNQRIYLPAGKAKFTLIDIYDIGLVAAKVITECPKHQNKSYELTNNEILTFAEMADKLSNGLGKKIKFISPNLLQFFLTKRKEGVPAMFILVMIMLHYFPRFQKTPKITDCVKTITGQEPKSFDNFVFTNKKQLQ
ncbi:MAG: NmrA family NAD(P)-binding protein [Bacteroidota bacterium]|nr:NmrA family NAD(P)-binding protein [Bacteroidota bacterium]